MDLDPEAVKKELAAVQEAYDQVNARLENRSRPNILSRLSKANSQAGEGQPQIVRSYAEYDRRSSRRFVNRNWNIARKRTAEGLFVDDNDDAGATENEDAAHGPPRKRSLVHGAGDPRHDHQNEGTQAVSARETGATHTPYNPYNESRQPHSQIVRSSHGGPPLAQHQDRGAGGEGRRRPFDTSRISFAPNAQQGENTNASDVRHLRRDSNARPRLDRHRRAAPEARCAGEISTVPQAGDADGAAAPMEEGELEVLPPPPHSQPKEDFVVEKRPERQAPVPDKVHKRNKRMFGALLGHLDGAERQEKKFEKSAVLQRRKELEVHAAERARMEGIKAREADRQRQFEARRRDIATKRELLLQQNMKQAKLLCAEKIAYARGLLRFIRTEAIPPILWEPAAVNKDVEQLFEQQATDFELWAGEQTDKLRLEQQGMRARAEKQWADIDRVWEERHKAKMGRWKSIVEPAKPAAKAVRSSVMTARDYHNREQHANRDGAAEAPPSAPEQAVGEGDGDHAAADEAEAHDEAYLIAEEAKVASEEPVDVGLHEQSRHDRSPSPERHAAEDSGDEADSGGMDAAGGPRHRSREKRSPVNNQHAATASENDGVDAGDKRDGDHSDDSLSLSV